MTHSPRLGGHGGRGHQVSRKTVRERRRSGVKPRRGHNFDNRLRNVERLQAEVRDAKAYQPFDPETVIAALLASASPILREDIGQELWVLVLQGATEPELRAAYRDVRIAVAKVELGSWNDVSLDAPSTNKHGQEFGSVADMIDEHGVDHRRHTRSPWIKDSWQRETPKRPGVRLGWRIYERAAREVRRLAPAQRVFDMEAWTFLIMHIARPQTWHVLAIEEEWSPRRKLEHGRKHREWWAAHPEARTAMAEKNQLMWAAKGDAIRLRLKESGTDWWARQPPEVREARREKMRQVWARRRAAQAQIAA